MIRAREQDTEYGEDMATKMSSWNKNRCVHAEKEQEIEVVGQLLIDTWLNERLYCANGRALGLLGRLAEWWPKDFFFKGKLRKELLGSTFMRKKWSGLENKILCMGMIWQLKCSVQIKTDTNMQKGKRNRSGRTINNWQMP